MPTLCRYVDSRVLVVFTYRIATGSDGVKPDGDTRKYSPCKCLEMHLPRLPVENRKLRVGAYRAIVPGRLLMKSLIWMVCALALSALTGGASLYAADNSKDSPG